MRLLLINPNTSDTITAAVAKVARAALPGVTVVPATGRFGARYIASRIAFAVAQHAALDAFAKHGAGCDAVLLACFGDPGLDALREIAPVPVISLIDAVCAEAGGGGRRFSIVTGGDRWGPMLDEALRLRRLEGQLASIRTVAPTGGEIARDPEGAAVFLGETCRRCIVEDGAEAVILGGAGLIGLAARLQPSFSQPILCSVESGLRATAAALAASGKAPPPLPGAVETVGLSPALAALFRGG